MFKRGHLVAVYEYFLLWIVSWDSEVSWGRGKNEYRQNAYLDSKLLWFVTPGNVKICILMCSAVILSVLNIMYYRLFFLIFTYSLAYYAHLVLDDFHRSLFILTSICIKVGHVGYLEEIPWRHRMHHEVSEKVGCLQSRLWNRIFNHRGLGKGPNFWGLMLPKPLSTPSDSKCSFWFCFGNLFGSRENVLAHFFVLTIPDY